MMPRGASTFVEILDQGNKFVACNNTAALFCQQRLGLLSLPLTLRKAKSIVFTIVYLPVSEANPVPTEPFDLYLSL